jgi:membrane-bound acyltransferase YfiQ involved in biofilm formation
MHWGWLPQVVGILRGFIEQTMNYLPYILLAIGIGLLADEIDALYRRRLFRILTLIAVAVWMCIYLGIPTIQFGKQVYSLVVFVALLRPLAEFRFRRLCTIAEYSYAVYILNMWILMIAWSVLYRTGIDNTAGIVLTGSVVVFGLSMLSSILLRKLFPYDWLFPLIPIIKESVIEKTYLCQNLPPAFAEAASGRQVTPFFPKRGNSSLL